MNAIRPKRSWVVNCVPLTSELAANQVAFNWADGKVYVKKPDGTIVSFTIGGSGGSTTSGGGIAMSYLFG